LPILYQLPIARSFPTFGTADSPRDFFHNTARQTTGSDELGPFTIESFQQILPTRIHIRDSRQIYTKGALVSFTHGGRPATLELFDPGSSQTSFELEGCRVSSGMNRNLQHGFSTLLKEIGKYYSFRVG